jgi:hypothetical protein
MTIHEAEHLPGEMLQIVKILTSVLLQNGFETKPPVHITDGGTSLGMQVFTKGRSPALAETPRPGLVPPVRPYNLLRYRGVRGPRGAGKLKMLRTCDPDRDDVSLTHTARGESTQIHLVLRKRQF